jgi:hypothetical protein
VGGEVSASIAPQDKAFFDDTGYESNPLRRLSMTLSASLTVVRPLALLVEVRAENFESARFYALYLRLKPWAGRPFDAQIGLIPPVFGAFGRRAYGSSNPLIGLPLAYQYLTTIRHDAYPSTADDLIQARGFGWLVRYPLGSPYAGPGLPIVDSQRWDTGAQVRIGREPLQLAVAVTQGSLSHPRVRDDNDGKQVSGRVQARPVPGLVVGFSGASGPYYSDPQVGYAPPVAEPGRARRQRAAGFDLEYARGHLVLRAEGIWTAWDVPAVDVPRIEDPLEARALSLEAVYRLAPGFDIAARLDRLGFGDVQGSTRRHSWDAPVSRFEGGVMYAVRRGLSLKAVYQHNWRDAGPPGRHGFPAAQVVWRF